MQRLHKVQQSVHGPGKQRLEPVEAPRLGRGLIGDRLILAEQLSVAEELEGLRVAGLGQLQGCGDGCQRGIAGVEIVGFVDDDIDRGEGGAEGSDRGVAVVSEIGLLIDGRAGVERDGKVGGGELGGVDGEEAAAGVLDQVGLVASQGDDWEGRWVGEKSLLWYVFILFCKGRDSVYRAKRN